MIIFQSSLLESINVYTKSDASDVTGISTYNALLMVNNIIQQPGENFDLIEDGAGTKTDLKFTGIATGLEYDVNRSPFPKVV